MVPKKKRRITVVCVVVAAVGCGVLLPPMFADGRHGTTQYGSFVLRELRQ